MRDAPERIWAGRWPHGGRAWRDAPAVHIKTAYVRADLVEALEAENQRLRGVLETIATTGRCEFAVVRAALRSTETSHD